MKRIKINNFKIPQKGTDIYNFAKKIFPINRSLMGNGNRLTLELIKKKLPKLKIHEVPSNTKVFDWKIPYEWNIVDAYIVDPTGKKIIKFKENNLHVVGYSTPINQSISLDELKKHLHYKKELPTAIPYVTSYYKKSWGFCLSYNQYKSLKKGTYKVFINSTLKKGSLTYADLLIKGRSNKEILLTSYICHPSLANNEVSGPSLLTYLAEFIGALKNRRYSYRIVFHPENLGAITYIKNNLKILKKNVVAGYVLSCVGDDKNYSFIPSRKGDSLSDKIARHVLNNFVKSYKEYLFLESGSDERRYCSPNVDLPIASILRTKYGNYKEYHTSKDDMSFISPKGFQGAFNVYLRVIRILENNFRYKTTTFCEPQLGKRGLYPNVSKWPNESVWKEIQKLINLLSYADGSDDLIDISEKIKTNTDDLLNELVRLEKLNLIKI